MWYLAILSEQFSRRPIFLQSTNWSYSVSISPPPNLEHYSIPNCNIIETLTITTSLYLSIKLEARCDIWLSYRNNYLSGLSSSNLQTSLTPFQYHHLRISNTFGVRTVVYSKPFLSLPRYLSIELVPLSFITYHVLQHSAYVSLSLSRASVPYTILAHITICFLPVTI